MLSEALRLIRVYHNKKLIELAKEMDISVSYLSEIENNKKKPTLELVEKYAKTFEISASSILFFSEELDRENKADGVKDRIRHGIIKFMQSIERFEKKHV